MTRRYAKPVNPLEGSCFLGQATHARLWRHQAGSSETLCRAATIHPSVTDDAARVTCRNCRRMLERLAAKGRPWEKAS